MKPSLSLVIGAVVLGAFSVVMIVAPSRLLLGFGVGTPAEGIVMTRDVGITLAGVALTNWLARDATGKVLRAMLVGNLVPHLLEFPVNAYQLATGLLPPEAAGGFVIHGVLALLFVLGLWGARTRPLLEAGRGPQASASS